MRRSPPTTIGSRAVKAAVSFSARSISLRSSLSSSSRLRSIASATLTGLGRPRIGGIGVAETALGALGPDRPRRRGGEAAQHLGFFQQRLVPEVHFGQFPAQSAEFANPHNGLAADGAAHGLDGVSIRGGEIEQKALAGLAQRVDRVIHLQRRFRRQPGSEGENALRRYCWESCDIRSEMSPLICGRLSPAAHEIRICGSANSSARKRSAWTCRPAMSARSRASLLAARTRVRISRIAATTEKPSSASAVVSTAISWRLRSKKVEIVCSTTANRRPRPARSPPARRRQGRSGRCVPMMCTTARSDASPRSRPTWFAPNRTTFRPERAGTQSRYLFYAARAPFANRMTISPTGVGR